MYIVAGKKVNYGSSVQHRLSVPNNKYRHFTNSSVFTCETSLHDTNWPPYSGGLQVLHQHYINITSPILKLGCSLVHFVM